MLRTLLLSIMLSLCASYQLAKMAPRAGMRVHKRAAPLLMQEQEETEASAAEEAPVGPMATNAIGSNPFSMEGIGKPSIGGGKFTKAEPIDESKRMSAGIPMVYLYAVFAVFIAGGVLTGGDGPHGFKMP